MLGFLARRINSVLGRNEYEFQECEKFSPGDVIYETSGKVHALVVPKKEYFDNVNPTDHIHRRMAGSPNFVAFVGPNGKYDIAGASHCEPGEPNKYLALMQHAKKRKKHAAIEPHMVSQLRSKTRVIA
jgi:hypothetical protein